MSKFLHKFILIITLASIFTLPFSIHIFGSEKEFTSEEIDLLKRTTRVRVVFNATSWLGEHRDIRSAIIRGLLNFTIVHGNEECDATFLVDYAEAKGRQYDLLAGAYNGTDIRCVIRMNHNKIGTVFEKVSTASSSSWVECPLGLGIGFNECLRNDAFKNFEILHLQGFKGLWGDILEEIRKR